MPQIEFKNVTKEYDGFKALDDVSFSVEKKEFVFIVGPSGAGKSTLVKLLIREELPTSGEVIFDGQDVAKIKIKDLPALRRRIGVVFQDFKILRSKSVFENVAVALEVVESEESEIKEVVPNVLRLVGLGDKAKSFPLQLSGGEIQRLAIARALAHEPDVLVADEPTGMIDPQSTDEVLVVLNKINTMGTTVLMATHNFSVVDRMRKRVIKLEKGVLCSDKKEGTYGG